tara:strand:- start:957 stop:2078 length:1122 start_codon:yes stop_codon:yes gene_type:complete
MISYFIPFIILTLLTSFEYSKKFDFLVRNKFLYFLVFLFFIIFIGLRYEIGCDWFDYKEMFEKYNALSLIEIIQRNLFFKQRIQELGHIFITSISYNIYFLNLIYSILFTLPLFYFCSKLKRTYFSLLISYPYYIIVVGMGPIRQAASISIFMLSILFISKRKFYSHILITIISSLLHQSSILFNGLIMGSFSGHIKKIKLSKKNIILLLFISLVIVFSLPSLINKVYFYISHYRHIMPGGSRLITPAKGAYYIWFINFIPSIIFLKNIKKFKFKKSLNKILIILSIFEFLLLPIIFFNSIIAYRLLLYFFPSSIFITSYIPDLEILNIKKLYFLNIIISSALISLIVWLKFAFHASCWVPYKNILLNSTFIN